jgi:hypothetical protein
LKISPALALLGLVPFLPSPLYAQATTALPLDAGRTYTGFGANAVRSNEYSLISVSQDTLPADVFSLSYDPSSASYTVKYTRDGSGATFSAANLSMPTYGYDNAAISLSYMSYATGSNQRQVDSFRRNSEYFAGVFGQATPSNAVPHSGAAYYTGIVDGYAGYVPGEHLSGTGDLLVNFYTGEIATGLNLSVAGNFIGRVDGRGSITPSSSQFTGDLFGSGNGLLGRFGGSFFGPTAQEAGYGFSLSTGDGTAIAGVLVATQGSLPPSSETVVLPPSSAGANNTLVGPLASDSFSAFTGRLMKNAAYQYNYAGTSATVAEALDFGALKISYDATNATYIVSDGSANATFTPANRQATSDAITSAYFIVDASTNNYRGETLTLLNAGPSNPYINLSYLSYGLWTDGEVSPQVQNHNRAFIYGVETPAGNLPRSGAALYNGGVDGYWTSNGNTYRLQGSDGSILANFYTGEVRTTLGLTAAAGGTSTTPSPIRVDGYGSIGANTAHFSGAAATADNTYTGSFQGGFYGPAAQEAGLSFVLRGPTNVSSISGVLVANQVASH